MRTIICLFLLAQLSACSINIPLDKEFEEVGKIRARLLMAETGKPMPGVFVQEHAYRPGSGSIISLSPPKSAYEYSYTDENGYFQVPKMEAGETFHYLSFWPDSTRFANHLVAPSGFRNGGNKPTDLYEAFAPKMVKMVMAYDTHVVRSAGVEYDLVMQNFNGYFQSSLVTKMRQDVYALRCYPEVQPMVTVIYSLKGSQTSESKAVPIASGQAIGDTMYTTVSMP